MRDQVAEEHGLALLAQAEHGVELAARLVGHDRAQELHVARGHLHVDQEVGARQREQHRDPPRVEDQRVEVEQAAFVVAHRDRERAFLVAIDRLADDVGGLVAIEGRVQHLDLAVDLHRRPLAEVGPRRAQHEVDVAVEILEAALPVEVLDDAPDGGTQAAVARVVARIHRRVGLDVFGGDRRAREQVVVVEVAAVQDLGGDRVEEGLGELGLAVVDQHADELQLDLLPGAVVEGVGVELVVQSLHRLVDAVVVELHALAHRVELLLPLRGLIELLGAARGLAKDAVVLVEALHQRLRDRLRDRAFSRLHVHRTPPEDAAAAAATMSNVPEMVSPAVSPPARPCCAASFRPAGLWDIIALR